jgi:exodeoxyribonuclease VII small subunit
MPEQNQTEQNQRPESNDGQPQNVPLEELFERLETVVSRMEEENPSLEESFRLYHEGMQLLKQCNDTIDQVEKKVLILDEEGQTHEF